MTKPTLALLTAYWAGKKMCGKISEDRCSIFCRSFSCRFLLAALLLAPLAALHAAERKLGDVVSNHTTTLVMKAGVRP